MEDGDYPGELYEPRKCRNCGIEIEYKRGTPGGDMLSGFCCGSQCEKAYRIESANTERWEKWDHANERINTNCKHCDKTIKRPRGSVERGRRNHFCSKYCQARYHYGDVTDDMGPNWTTQRYRTLDRDGYECQRCGMTNVECQNKYETSLNVHHIVPRREYNDLAEANKLDNLVSLCPSCHQIEEHEEEPTIIIEDGTAIRV